MNWAALLGAIAAGFNFFGELLGKKKPTPVEEEPVDAQAARAGTAAGAAANTASHTAGKAKLP